MATGKTNARWITVVYNSQDISTDVTNIDLPITKDQTDVTGYSDGVHNVTFGHPDQPVTITGHFNDTATTGIHTVMSAAALVATGYTLTVAIGIGAAPVATNPEYEGVFGVASYVVNGDLTVTVELVPTTSTAPAWGAVS
jgi:hypothetical protein